MDSYELTIAGLRRTLPLVEVAPGLRIASFVMLGDTALVEAVASALAERPELVGLEVLVCPEAKAIPLTHALARILGLDYVVARKTLKAYMTEAIIERVVSITTEGEQILAFNGPDIARLTGRRVGIVDDVVSTGGSLASLEGLLARVPCTVVARVAALLEGGGHSGDGLVYLGKLPVFDDRVS
jgi:adenine phosphoribosyltransferase